MSRSRRERARPRWAVLLLCLLALPFGSSRGGDDAKGDAALDREFGFLEAEELEKIPLSIVSRGPAIAAGQAPAVVDVITAEEIRASGARTLAELLAQRVGMDVSIDRVVPRGLNTSPSNAGVTLSNHRTLLLVDGRPTNGLFFGEFLAGRELPLEHIARIEIIRGPGSALYGTNAMAGVINVVTKDYADEPGPGVIGEYGSHSTRRIDGFAGAGGPSLNGNFFLRYFATGGPDSLDRNDNQRQYFGFARAGLGPLTLEGEGLDFAAQSPGVEGAPTLADHANRSRYSLGAKLDQALGERFRLGGRIYTNLYQTRILALAGNPDRAAYDEQRVGEELSLTYRPFDWLSVTFGGEVRQEEGEVGPGRCAARDAGGGVRLTQGCRLRQKVYAGFLEDQIALPFDVTLTAGFRYDDVSISGGRVNPRFNVVWKPEPRTAIKLGYGEAFRAPSFFELRGAQQLGGSDFVLGNPELRPEIVKTAEGEIDHSFGRAANLRASAFYTRGSDLIGQQSSVDLLNSGICPPCGVPSTSVLAGLCPVIQVLGGGGLALTTRDSCYVNSTRVDVYGVEAGAGGVLDRLPIPGALSYGVNYTFQDTASRAPGIPGEPDLPLAPRHKGNVLFDYRPIPELSIFSHTRIVGRQFADGVQKQPLETYVNEDVNLLYRLSRGIDVGVGIYNVLGDDRHEALGVPREPRTVLGHVAYRFVPAPAIPGGVAPGPEPDALGRARAAVARAQAAGADRLALLSYREALAHLSIAEELQRRSAGRDRVAAAAELARKSAELAEQAAATAAVPTPTASAPPAAPPTPMPTAPRPRTPRPGGPRPTPVTPAAPLPSAPGTPTSTPLPSRIPPPAPTPTLPPIPTATPNVAAKRVLLLQSDSAVAVYRDTALRLVGSIGARVEIRDLHGDREQGADAVRGGAFDLVVAVGSLAATVAKDNAAAQPAIFCAVLNPQRYDLGGADLGGVSFEISAADQLEQLHAALPRATRIGVIYDPQKSAAAVAAAERAAGRLGVQIVKAVAREPREVDPVFRSIRREIDVLWLIPDTTVITRESFELLALQAAESRIPFVAFSEAFVRQGALLALYPDPDAVGDQCAALAGRVLRGEMTPAEVGVISPDRYRVAVNRRVEDQLGIRIAPNLRADVEIR